jgi:hypothetical protein
VAALKAKSYPRTTSMKRMATMAHMLEEQLRSYFIP